ncbi:hypothetical protein JRQ81_008586 [Phrynocephalus forsythii]|uniref:3'-5' exonuclease domain-containing protein n=1 Tax=Phrynocephalus forsythii TaxID=171643 RepID=A0A9Q0XBA7_9SAUR|nr:hypothetical protein JRQ81_008586 [Phrynocephalus forsythii]
MLEGSSPIDSGASSAQDPEPLRQRLQALWEAKDMEKLKEEIQRGYATLEDPLGWLLDVLEGSEDWKAKGHSLATCLVKELQTWLRTHPRGQLSGLRLKKVHARVFPILAQCHGNLLDPLIVIYQLHAADHHYLLGQIEHLYHRKKYKEAAILSIKFHLQPDLNLEEMCVPLLLQEKTDLVEAYVEGYPILQERLLRMVDAWFAPGFQTKDVIRNCQGLSSLRPEKFNQRLLNKTVFRFLDRYGLDPALCPNVVNQRHLGTLKYLLHKRFVEKTMTHENWMDHVQSTVGKNPWLQEKLVQLLVRHGGLGVAAWWARHYGLPKERLPYGLMEEMEKLKLQEREEDPPELMADAGENRRKEGCYHLPLPRDRVLFVSTWAELPNVEKAVLQPGQVVGIDMEWRPSFGAVGGKPRVSLVQLAVQGWVFLLDMLQLLGNGREEEEESLAHFFRNLFADPTVTKIDLHGLRRTCAAFREVDKQMCSFLDLLAVQKQLPKCSEQAKKAFRDVDGDVFPAAEGSKRVRPPPAERGLSLLVHEVLGKPLDKTEQLSNWEKRPLRESQILYAAGKAHGGAEAKKPASEEEALDPRAESSGHAPGEVPAVSASISVQDFRVVCDNMLQGLGRYLRCLGVDVQILENEDEHRKAAEIARQEGRVILTSGLPYHTLQSQVGKAAASTWIPPRRPRTKPCRC